MRTNVLNLPNKSIEKQRPTNIYTKKSRTHPAKMNTEIAKFVIEKYTREGDWVIDVMAGIGTVPVEAGWLGRCATGIEYEPEWCEEMDKNLRKVPRLHGLVRISTYVGDCRYLIPYTQQYEGPYDLILFSPPYGPLLTSKKHDEGVHAVKLLQKIRDEAGCWPVPREVLRQKAKEWREDPPEGKYSKDPENVGNLNQEEYEEAMEEIYKECLQVVESDGHMVLVTRNPCKNWKQVPLDMLTIRLAQRAGWIFKERWYAPVYRHSFWINQYKKKCEEKGLHDVVPKFDDILVFEVP